MKVHEKLAEIQKQLNAPKSQYNSFGKYKYRSCEDILQAVKPLLGGFCLKITDDIVEVGGRVYVKATACLFNEHSAIHVDAFAREPDNKKGMDSSQITGAASSYARKYALNGLFAIDDNKDADTKDNRSEGNPQPKKAAKKEVKDYPALVEWIMDEDSKNRQQKALQVYELNAEQLKEIKNLA